MRIRILSVRAAVALVGACETASEESGKASGSGATALKLAYTAKAPAKASTAIKAGTQQDLVVNVGDRIFFDLDKYSVRVNQRSHLDKQAAWMKANPSVTVAVEGHCDERGTREYNLALGERRGAVIGELFQGLGIDPSAIRVVSYGEERSVALGHDETAWAMNRRVEILY